MGAICITGVPMRFKVKVVFVCFSRGRIRLGVTIFTLKFMKHEKPKAWKAWSMKSMISMNSMKSPAEYSLYLHTSCYLRKGSMRCVNTQFDQILSFLSFSATEQWGIWSDCTDMFASLNLPPFDPCNQVAAQLFLIYIFVANLYIIYMIYILFI